MGYRTVRIGDVATFRKESIKPVEGVTYHCYSLPAFDNAKTPEVLNGSEILSNKLKIETGDILVRLCPKKWCKRAFQSFKRSAVIS